MIAYICEQGAKIRREGERLIVCGREKERTLFSHRLTQLQLFGNIHLTVQARSLLLAKKIDTVFLSASGSYRGRLFVEEGENVFLRKKQYDLLADADFQLSIAKEIVIAKLHNQAAMLGRIKREHKVSEAAIGVEELKIHIKSAHKEKSIDSLRGVEGSGAAIYFRHFANAFHRELGFSKRTFHHPHAYKEMTYTEAVNWQAREYRRVVEGERDKYMPLVWH